MEISTAEGQAALLVQQEEAAKAQRTPDVNLQDAPAAAPSGTTAAAPPGAEGEPGNGHAAAAAKERVSTIGARAAC